MPISVCRVEIPDAFPPLVREGQPAKAEVVQVEPSAFLSGDPSVLTVR